jgi:gas vesicle protein|tara:strand:+ start:168 stop:599 length:432 start_codon:yes stop_codon:yes gene_type:complete
MAEIEYKGIKMNGSKLMIALPLLGSLIGGLWGGFELYNRLLIAEQKLAKLRPEMIQAEMEKLVALTDVIKDNLSAEITEASRLARKVESDSAITQREVRNDVYAMEKEMQGRFRDMDKDIRNTRTDLENRMKEILENPLNDIE